MNLIIEQGNTSSKVAIYDSGASIYYNVYKKLSSVELGALLDEYPIDKGIFSSVIDLDDALIEYLKSRLNHFLFFDDEVKLPIEIEYLTPRTLGKDRIAAVVGANWIKPNQDLLVIDAGTAITYELLEASGKYKGGNISPGMTTRFKALNQFTKKLPLVNETEDVPFLGRDTTSAIQAGVVNGIVFEMDGYIDALKVEYPSLLVFLTGGHSFYFERRLKNTIFADINLVLTGLNRILEYNVENK